MRGKFIVLEGIDGCGKDTQMNLLVDRMNHSGFPTFPQHDPSNSCIGKLIRQNTMGNPEYYVTDEVLVGLYALERLNHINCPGGLYNQINRGINVVQTRYVWSTLAYGGRHVQEEYMRKLVLEANKRLEPDLYILLDIEPEEAFIRLEQRNKGRNEIWESPSTLHKARLSYNELSKLCLDNNPNKCLIVDGNLSKEEISDIIWERVSKLFREV